MTSLERINTIKHIVKSINNRELKEAARFVTPDFVRHDLTSVFLAKGTGSGEVKDFLHSLITAFPDLYINIEDIFAYDEKLAARYGFIGTHKGNLFGFQPSGRKVHFSGINIYRFKNESIAEVWQLWDWITVLNQTGNLDQIRNRS